MRATSWLLAATLVAGGCSSNAPAADQTPQSKAPQSNSQHTARPTKSATNPTVGGSAEPRRLIHAVAASQKPPGHELDFARAGSGSTLVTFTGAGADRTWYRVYDRRWRPTSPLLISPVTLELVRGLRASFLAVADRQTGGHEVSWWVRVSPDGSLQLVHATSGMTPLNPGRARHKTPVRAGDDYFGTAGFGHGKLAFFRPTGHRVHLAALPGQLQTLYWDDVSPSGQACKVTRLHRRGPLMLLTWSADDPGTSQAVKLRSVVPARMPVGIVVCAARRGQVMLFPGNDYNGIYAAVTWAHLPQPRVTTYRIDRRFDQWREWTLPGGRDLFVTNGGILIAKNRTNTAFLFRRAPNITNENDAIWVVGTDLLAPPRRYRGFRVPLSTDFGKTWRTLDLRAGLWTRPR